MSEWTELFESLGLALHKTEEHMGLGEALGTELDGRELSSGAWRFNEEISMLEARATVLSMRRFARTVWK